MELGDIIWSFRKLHMKFQMGGKEFMLQRDKMPSYFVTIISSEKLGRVLSKTG